MSEPDMTSTLIRRNRRLLVVHNVKGDRLRVEAPGGKRNNGESLDACSQRELLEELGIRIRILGHFGDYETQSPEGRFLVRMYLGRIVEGVPEIQESEKGKLEGPYWRSYEELMGKWESYLVENLRNALIELRRADYL